MSDSPDFDRIYRLLDVDPDDGWDAVQHAFRRKAQAYHPDRAAGNPRIEKIAKKRFEELTLAFDELRRFRRIFGDLPPIGLGQQLSKLQPDDNDLPPNEPILPTPSASSTATRWILMLGGVVVLAATVLLSVLEY